MLLGRKDGPGASPSTVMVDKKCLSCSGNPAVPVQAFKLACLNYTPNSVKYRRKTYKRAELLEIKEILLNNAWERATSTTSIQNRDLKQVFDRNTNSRQRSRSEVPNDFLPHIKLNQSRV